MQCPRVRHDHGRSFDARVHSTLYAIRQAQGLDETQEPGAQESHTAARNMPDARSGMCELTAGRVTRAVVRQAE